MEISVRDDGTIMQYGIGLGDLDGCTVQEIDNALLPTLQEPGEKRLQADGSITVTPPEPVVVPDPGSDPRAAAFQALIATATSPEQAIAIEQVAVALGIVIPTGG